MNVSLKWISAPVSLPTRQSACEWAPRAEERVELIKKAEARNAEVELKAILERQKETQRQLDAIYAEKGDEWVAEIVARATGDDK